MSSDGLTARTPSRAARWAPPAIWVVAILIGTSWPGVRVGPDDLALDKVAHFVAYAVLAALSLRATETPYLWRTALKVIVIVSVFGAIDEWHQSFIPNRSMSFLDWVADTVGAVAGALAARYVPIFAPRRVSAQ